MKKLKETEQRVYDSILRSLSENGYAPGVRDLCDVLGYLDRAFASAETGGAWLYYERRGEEPRDPCHGAGRRVL